ncbi:MAG TPA: hypothetical protein VJ987_04800 [Anaerolineales bacterium]|nr:hypothetical protein [Anaerolineales bacterium]
MNTLEKLEKKLATTKEQRSELVKLLDEQRASLKVKLSDQSQAIRDGRSTSKLTDEIVNLRVRIEGTETGIKDLDFEIQKDEQERAKELNTIRLSRMAEINKDALQIQDEIYALFLDAANKTDELKEKYSAYRADLKSGDHHTLTYVQTKRANLISKIATDLPALMDFFPNEITTKKEITPTDLRRKLNKR